MHRNPLLSLIAQYQERYREETERIEQFIAFVKENDNCFDRDLKIGHVTGSAWVVNQDKTKVLLTHHKKLNKWLQLGGHADGNPDILSVALRETFEESGLEHVSPLTKEIFDLDIHPIPKIEKEEAHHHFDVRFALQTTGSEQFEVSDESHALAWLQIPHLGKINPDKSIQRMQRKWLSEYKPTRRGQT